MRGNRASYTKSGLIRRTFSWASNSRKQWNCYALTTEAFIGAVDLKVAEFWAIYLDGTFIFPNDGSASSASAVCCGWTQSLCGLWRTVCELEEDWSDGGTLSTFIRPTSSFGAATYLHGFIDWRRRWVNLYRGQDVVSPCNSSLSTFGY